MAEEVKAGNVSGKAEVSVWIARRANVVLGEEWDNALQICADYLDAAGESDEEIAAALIEIADAISPATTGITHIVEVDPAVEPGEVSDSETETEEVAALPPEDSDNAENQNDVRNCPNGTCPGTGSRAAGNAGGYYQRYGYGWWYW